MLALLLTALLGPVAQLAYSGPPAAVWVQKAGQLQAAGYQAGAAAAYQPAYAAYTSVDDSEDMQAALAGKAAAGGVGNPVSAVAAAPRAAARLRMREAE